MRGHIRRQGKGTWAIVLDIGYDHRGKRRQKWHTVRGARRDAQRELTRLIRELDTGAYVEPAKLTVGELLEQWLTAHAKQNVSAKSYERYAEITCRHLIPALGAHQLAQLRPLHIQGYYGQALLNGRLRGKGGLAPQTVLHHHRLLKQALKQAVKWQLLARNPADAVDPPRPLHHEMSTLSEPETAALLKAAAGSPIRLPILLAVATGMRRGEILALRWGDVDLEKGYLSVRQSLELTRAGFNFKQPKTAKGRRLIALPALLCEALQEHRRQQAQERLRLGPVYENLDLVCARADGRVWHPQSFSKEFKRVMGSVEIRRVRFHDLRHSHASHLLRQGVHPKVVSERLGHATVAITLDRYSHVLPGLQEDAALKIDRVLRAAIGSGN